jgi:hypothetical protein
MGRWAIVATSATVFGLCLTRTAFVTLRAPEGPHEVVNNSALESLAAGWLGLAPALWSVFLPYPVVLAALILTIGLAAVDRCRAAAIAGFLTTVLMLAVGTLGWSAWLANPVLASAWVLALADRRRGALVAGLIALVWMLSALQIDRVPLGLKNEDVPILAWSAGYWLWVASAAILVAGISVGMLGRRSAVTDAAASAARPSSS